MVANVTTAIFCLQSNTFYAFVTEWQYKWRSSEALEKQQEWLMQWFLTSNASVLAQNKSIPGYNFFTTIE